MNIVLLSRKSRDAIEKFALFGARSLFMEHVILILSII